MTQTQAMSTGPWDEPAPTAVLVLADGTVLEGFGLGATGQAVGEVCFNTAMTGYEEILTDPSYAGQIITFTFPHIGNVGTNDEDIETVNMAAATGARGVILHSAITAPSNYRASRNLDDWLKSARHRRARRHRHPRAHRADPRKGHAQRRDRARPRRQVRSRRAEEGGQGLAWPGRHGPGADGHQRPALHLGRDAVGAGTKASAARSNRSSTSSPSTTASSATSCGCSPAPAARSPSCRRTTSAEDILALKPDGVFLSNGPGDPAATGDIRRAGDQEAGRLGHADLRDLPRPPDARHRDRRQDARRCIRAITAPIIR